MDSTGFPAPSSGPASTLGPGTILDRPEPEIDRPETDLPTRPTGMVLRSLRHAG